MNSAVISQAYRIISEFYKDKIAKRSGVPYINHIDEGIAILKEINANDKTIAAYCLHPILQSDEALKNNFSLLQFVDFDIIILLMEYRKTANAYLSKRVLKSIDEIELSPLLEVNQMLWADKLQNYKDFKLYHQNKHERSTELNEYFNNWINRLIPIIFSDLYKRFTVNDEVTFTYKNWKDNIEKRIVIPQKIFFGSTEYYPTDQVLLSGFDLNRNSERVFAFKNIIE